MQEALAFAGRSLPRTMPSPVLGGSPSSLYAFPTFVGLGSALACFFRSLAFAEFDELLAGHSCLADPDRFGMSAYALVA